MLDIDLVQGKPTLRVDFLISLAADLLDSASLVMSAPWLEGLDQWAYATHAALPPDLKDDLELVLFLMGKGENIYTRIFQLPPEHPVHRGFTTFASWLDTLTEADFAELIQEMLVIMSHVCEESKDAE